MIYTFVKRQIIIEISTVYNRYMKAVITLVNYICYQINIVILHIHQSNNV